MDTFSTSKAVNPVCVAMGPSKKGNFRKTVIYQPETIPNLG